jgi:gamma-glutamyltranspeptidase/glutathione hydrolase
MPVRKEAPIQSWRPTVVGRSHAVACGHYLATEAAMRVLAQDGNAIDAGVTAAMTLAIVQPDIVSFAGVAPTLVLQGGRVTSLAGLGYWPAATDVQRLRREGGAHVPEGILRTVMPAAPATHIEALRRFGTISFETAATPALEIAREGFAMYPVLRHNIEFRGAALDRWAENASVFRPGGRTPNVGSLVRQPGIAGVIERMIAAERRAGGSREAKLAAVHDCFYRGEIAGAIAAHQKAHGGFMTREDLAGFTVPVEASIACRYDGYEVHTCDVWCQGISLLEALKIVEGMDLAALGHNSPAYLHRIAEALNLAFADREAYVGDPRFVDVPTAGLLSDVYAAMQRARIRDDRAFGKMPDAGLPPGVKRVARTEPARSTGPVPVPPDTIYCCVADRHGNVYSATLSDNAHDTPMVPGMGLSISSRGTQSRLDEDHPSCVAPGKRPRLTPAPALALKGGRFFMGFGTPGGDIQAQAMLQVFLNVTRFGMAVQQAIEAPRVGTFSFPNSFAPHQYLPGRLCIENRVDAATIDALRALGHDVEVWEQAVNSAGAVCAVMRDPQTGLLHAGADPRREAYAAAW